jgi:Arc/MetJ family transcription regulator
MSITSRNCDILYAIVRTTLELDDVLMEALMARHPGASKRQAVEAAIRDYLERDAISRVLALKGVVEVEDVSEELRRDRE